MERLLRVGDFLSAVLVTCFIIWMELFFYYSYCLTHYTEVPVPSGHFFVMTDFIFMLIVHHSYELLEPSIPRWVFLETLKFVFYWCYYKFGFYPVVFFCQLGLFYFLYGQKILLQENCLLMRVVLSYTKIVGTFSTYDFLQQLFYLLFLIPWRVLISKLNLLGF